MHLDGYCKELELAFEHQGRQHYEKSGYFKYEYQKIAERDAVKKKLCSENGITLIEVPEIGHYLKLREVQSYIVSKILSIRPDLDYIKNCDQVNLDYKKIFTSRTRVEFEKIKKIVEEKGGGMRIWVLFK
jgi:hypothetical protein